MILLITPCRRAGECAQAIEEATGESTHVAENLRQAATRLRSGEYVAVVADQSLLETEPDEGELILQHMGTAIPVPVNFAISGIERVLREVRAALRRRQREEGVARQAAEQTLRSELKSAVTAMLLSCEVVLSMPGLPSAAETRIRAVHELACQMRKRLGLNSREQSA